MGEVLLEEFEEYYNNKIDLKYSKIKKAVKKLMIDIETNLVEIKNSVDRFQEAAGDIGEKATRSLNFFTDRINKQLDEIEIPDDNQITHENLTKLSNEVKKLFTVINEIARKALPKFHKEVQPQIKELNYLTRKLQKRLAIFNQFLKKKYGDLKSAEELVKKKLPKFFTLKDNIENVKMDLTNFENEFEERKNTQSELTAELMKLEKSDLFKELEKLRDELFKHKIKVNDELGFKKALKKLKVELEKNSSLVPGLDINYLKEFLKNPIQTLSNDTSNMQNFSELMVKLRHALEENKLNLKADKKEKTIEHINKIFDEKQLYKDIDKIKDLKSKIAEMEKKISEAGISSKLEEVKNQISINTVKLEHLENDLEKKNSDFTRYLNVLKKEREDFHDLLSQEIGEDVRIKIEFTF
ncbi:MAG: hypothetical protein JW891_10150 [Candidatus Lokiarchaeota archaeon]|nr:hypothetical protein [Candidatus Lokiarchaeota archaeon]